MAQKTPYYDTKMLPKVVLVKTVFLKVNISNNVKQNIDETHSKISKIHKKTIPAYGI